jgi:uncharacterized repeat protein (TIGR01451 family)
MVTINYVYLGVAFTLVALVPLTALYGSNIYASAANGGSGSNSGNDPNSQKYKHCEDHPTPSCVGAASTSLTTTPNAATVTSGSTVLYTYTETNTGSVPISDVSITDNNCSPVSFVSDSDNDGASVLDVGETMTFQCSTILTQTTTNTATATGVIIFQSGKTTPAPVETATATVTVSSGIHTVEVIGSWIGSVSSNDVLIFYGKTDSTTATGSLTINGDGYPNSWEGSFNAGTIDPSSNFDLKGVVTVSGANGPPVGTAFELTGSCTIVSSANPVTYTDSTGRTIIFYDTSNGEVVCS